MKTNKYVVIYISGHDLYEQTFEDYDEAYAFVEGYERAIDCGKYGAHGDNIENNKAYIIKIENICLDGGDFKLETEPHT